MTSLAAKMKRKDGAMVKIDPLSRKKAKQQLNYLGSGQNEEVAKALSNLGGLTNLVKY